MNLQNCVSCLDMCRKFKAVFYLSCAFNSLRDISHGKKLNVSPYPQDMEVAGRPELAP